MKIAIRRTGGFAGIEERLAELDDAALPQHAAAELRDRVRRLSAWCARRPESPGADRLRYEVELAEPGAAPRTLAVTDEGEDEPGVALVRELLALAGAGPR